MSATARPTPAESHRAADGSLPASAGERVRARTMLEPGEAAPIPGWTLEHPMPAVPSTPTAPPPRDRSPSGIALAIPRPRGLRPRTIRGWLRAGFGANLLMLAAAGGVGVAGVRAATARADAALAELTEQHETVQQVGAAVLREIIVGSRQAQTGDTSDLRRYQAVMEETDALRRRAMAVHGLSVAERARLESVGRAQSAIEARLVMVRAYRALGRPAPGETALAEAMQSVASVDRDLAELTTAAAARGRARQSAMADALREEELKLGAVLVVALALAGFFAGGALAGLSVESRRRQRQLEQTVQARQQYRRQHACLLPDHPGRAARGR